MDGVDRRPHAFGNLLHVDVGRCRRSGVPENTLHIFHRPLLLGQCRNGSANDLEGQLRQVEIASKFMKHSLAIVVGVEEPSNLIGEDEIVRGQKG